MFFRQHAAAFAEGERTYLRASLLAKSLLLAITAVNCAHADSNLLPNGDFSNAKQITGWTADPTGSISFSTLDLDASASSGSLLASGNIFQPGSATSSCFRIEPLTSYGFGGEFFARTDGGLNDSGEATFSCSSFLTTNCSGPAIILAIVQLISTALQQDHFLWTLTRRAAPRLSAQCSVSIESTFTDNPEGSPALLNVDNLYFKAYNPDGISSGGYLNRSWYDPTQSGQGFQLEFTGQAHQLIAAWFTFAPDGSGKPTWIYAQGEYDPAKSSVTIPAEISSGTSFPPAFHGSDITKTPWGTLTFTFTDCSHASVAWNSSIPSYGSGTQELTRLTSMKGLSCPQ